MSGFSELIEQCERRGWMVCIDGSYPLGVNQPGFAPNCLEVRVRRTHELLAHVCLDPAGLDQAALDAAKALERQGLVS